MAGHEHGYNQLRVRWQMGPHNSEGGGVLADGRWVKQGHVIRILQALVCVAYILWHLCRQESAVFLCATIQLLPDNTLGVRNYQLPTGCLLSLVMVGTEVWPTGSVYAISMRPCLYSIRGLLPQSPCHFYNNLQRESHNPNGPPTSVTW